jgi:hypothetical protein
VLSCNRLSAPRISPQNAASFGRIFYLLQEKYFMTSAARIAANRENAQKSTGPRSDPRRACSILNAFKHGLTAVNVTLKDEDLNDYRRIVLETGSISPQLVPCRSPGWTRSPTPSGSRFASPMGNRKLPTLLSPAKPRPPMALFGATPAEALEKLRR